jgi:hypothetical protein
VILAKARIFAPRYFFGGFREEDYYIYSGGFHRRNDGACR